MSRSRPSSSLGFFSERKGSDERANGDSLTSAPQSARKSPFAPFRRRSQVLTLSSMNSQVSDAINVHSSVKEDRSMVPPTGDHSDIGEAPIPAKTSRQGGFGFKRPSVLTTTRFGNGTSRSGSASSMGANQENRGDASGDGAEKRNIATLRRRLSRPLTPLRSESDDDRSGRELARTSSALDYYQNHGPTQGLSLREWPSSQEEQPSRIPRPSAGWGPLRRTPDTGAKETQVTEPETSDPDLSQGRTGSQSVRQRSFSMTMAGLVRRPSLRSSQILATPPSKPRRSQTGVEEAAISTPEAREQEKSAFARVASRFNLGSTSSPAKYHPQTSSQSTASPFLNTVSARAHKRQEMNSPQNSSPALLSTTWDGRASSRKEIPRLPDHGERRASDQGTGSENGSRSSKKELSASAWDDEFPSAASRSFFRSRLQSQDSRLKGKKNGAKLDQSDPPESPGRRSFSNISPMRSTRNQDARSRKDSYDDRSLTSRPSSPFGLHPNTSLHSLGQHIGGIGAAVGRRGWDMMRTWGSSPGNSRSMDSRTPSERDISVDSLPPALNPATATWLAVLGDKHLRAPSSVAASQRDAIFGAPLRQVVLQTRIGHHLHDATWRRESPVENASAARESGSNPRDIEFGAASRQEARLKYLPAVTVRCIEAVERWGFDEEGIYRLSGRSSHTTKLRQVFDMTAGQQIASGDLDLASISPADLDLNSVCSVLKSFLRELPDTIIPQTMMCSLNEALYQQCGISNVGFVTDTRSQGFAMDLKAVDSTEICSDASQVPREELCNILKPFLDALPAANWYLLREITLHLGDMTQPDVVRRTRMPLSNLCLILAPTLCISVPVLQAIVENRAQVFDSVTPTADEALDNLVLPASQWAGSLVSTSPESLMPVTPHRLPSLRLSPLSSPSLQAGDACSNRLSVATVTADEKRASITSMSTLQDGAFSERGTERTEVYLPVINGHHQSASDPLQEHRHPSVQARTVQQNGKAASSKPGKADACLQDPASNDQGGYFVAGSSSADSSLPSSYWTGGDRDSTSSVATDDVDAQVVCPLERHSPKSQPSNSPTSAESSSRWEGNRSASARSISSRGSALDRPRPPTRGGAVRVTGAQRIKPTRHRRTLTMASSASSSTTASSVPPEGDKTACPDIAINDMSSVQEDSIVHLSEALGREQMYEQPYTSTPRLLGRTSPSYRDGVSVGAGFRTAQSTPVMDSSNDRFW